MKVGFYSIFPTQMGDCMFTQPNVASGDNLLLPFVRLRQAAMQAGINCQTTDMADMDQFDVFVFCEMPERRNRFLQYAKGAGKPTALIISENYFIRKENANRRRYRDFDAVFTYDDAAVDNGRIIKCNYAFDLPCPVSLSVEHKQKLAVMICSNQKKDRKHLVYAERRKTIQWFEDNHPDDFDLYGFRWERGTAAFQSHPFFQRFLRRTGILKFLPRRMYPSWKGCIERKRQVLGSYYFSFCYENTKEIPGYITEKIFDVMMAGTVPVYLGAENTPAHIPQECYINRANFKDHDSLYTYLKCMPDAEYKMYLGSIRDFLSTDKSREFHITAFVEKLTAFFRRNEKAAYAIDNH